MNNKFAKLQKFISENYDDLVVDLTDSYRQLLISIAKNNQVVVDPNVTLQQAWELVSPYNDDLNLHFSVVALIRKSTMEEVFFSWEWIAKFIHKYISDTFSKIENSNYGYDTNVFEGKFDTVAEWAEKAYSSYYKRKLKEIPNRRASHLIETANFKELLEFFEQTFPDDHNLTYGKNLDLYRGKALPGFGGRMRVIEAIAGVESLEQKTNSDFKDVPTDAKDLQDYFEKVLFCLRNESRGFENPSFQFLTRAEKTLAKQEHNPWDTFLLKLAKASLKNDTLEIFGAVLILLEYAEKPEAKSILSKDNTNFKMEVVTHLRAVESSINDFLWRKADGDKLIYNHLIDLFTYLAKAQ